VESATLQEAVCGTESVRGLASVEAWFRSRSWSPRPFQREAWQSFLRGESGLIHSPTGAGKTLAGTLGLAAELAGSGMQPPPLSGLIVTPLRATSRDATQALAEAFTAIVPGASVESRSGDTPTAARSRQRAKPPTLLVTTPESLCLLLADPAAAERFANLRLVVLDEWHELLGGKRGVQVELALSRLRAFSDGLRTWALSATVGDLDAAAHAAVGDRRPFRIVRDGTPRPIEIEAVLPAVGRRMPWAGHLGLGMLEEVLARLDPAATTLLFTNTRSQAERWFAAILEARPAWAETTALHHGSIDLAIRERIEAGLKGGSLRLVVCTSSLDLGVDFAPVERVVQVGSPKGIARLVQRAGRSGHRPDAACRILCVPTHAIELVEIAAARDAVARGEIEPRAGLSQPLDCLVQHLVTAGLGGGFEADRLFEEVRTAWSFRGLERPDFDWCIDLAARGGATLAAYPQHHRLRERDGRLRVEDRRIAATHRLNIGTITAEPTVTVRLQGAGVLGAIEEDFVSRLRAGDRFLFAGRSLELVRLRELVAVVREARGPAASTPRWAGARMPISTTLASALRRTLDEARRGRRDTPELQAAAAALAAQAARSRIPAADSILAELHRHRGGCHLLLHPFAGRLVHEGLAVLLALRMGRRCPGAFALSFNDYGVCWWSGEPYDFASMLDPQLFSVDGLAEDLVEAVNLGELSRRQFREIARISGLVPQRPLGGEASPRRTLANASLLFEVFCQFDPENLLLRQSRSEVLDRQCEGTRLADTLRRLGTGPIELVEIASPGPLSLPLIADRLGTTLSTEGVLEQLAAMGVEDAALVVAAREDALTASKPRAAARRRGARP
jgi:ATP-dependent Lhr-like helicase